MENPTQKPVENPFTTVRKNNEDALAKITEALAIGDAFLEETSAKVNKILKGMKDPERSLIADYIQSICQIAELNEAAARCEERIEAVNGTEKFITETDRHMGDVMLALKGMAFDRDAYRQDLVSALRQANEQGIQIDIPFVCSPVEDDLEG